MSKIKSIKFGQAVKLGIKGQEVLYLTDKEFIKIDELEKGVLIYHKDGIIFVSFSNIAYMVYDSYSTEKAASQENTGRTKEKAPRQ